MIPFALLALNRVEVVNLVQRATPIIVVLGYLLAASWIITFAIRYGDYEENKRITISAIIMAVAPAILHVLYRILIIYVVAIPGARLGGELCPDRELALKPLVMFGFPDADVVVKIFRNHTPFSGPLAL